MTCNLHGIHRFELHKMGYLFRFAVMFSFTGRRNSSKNLLHQHESLKDALLEEAAADTVVPKGYLAVYVGPDMRRFVIPTSYLCRPALRELMERAEEEFGFQQAGGLRIPCDEDYFERVIRALDEETQKTIRARRRRVEGTTFR